MRIACALWSNPPCGAISAFSASSPVCPNGGWPRSWASATASVSSTFSPSVLAIVRATCATSIEWVRRVRK